MIVLGLTGGIAMGKSRASAVFGSLGVPVFDADAAVHALMAPGGVAVGAIDAAFPGCRLATGGVDRQALGRFVFADPPALRRLEAILHPLVRAAEGSFLRRCCRAEVPLAVLDIPLLFETGGEARVDAVAVVSAHPLLQEQRALRRPGMNLAKLTQIRAKQAPDSLRRRRADYLIPSGRDRGAVIAAVGEVVRSARGLTPHAWPQGWLSYARSLHAA